MIRHLLPISNPYDRATFNGSAGRHMAGGRSVKTVLTQIRGMIGGQCNKAEPY